MRGYRHYVGSGRPRNVTPELVERCVVGARRLDLVLCFQDPAGNLDGWLAFVRDHLRQFGPLLAGLQVTEEANVRGYGQDGQFARTREALVAGVVAARDEARRLGLDVPIGFNAAPSFDPADDFWPELGRLGGHVLAGAVGYVGLDFFPDVFTPIAPERLTDLVAGALRKFRDVDLPLAGIPRSVPMRVTENGWPTGDGWPPERQAEVMEAVIRTVHSLRQELNLTHYELFALRDADSSRAGILHNFGILRDDYTPKPAFETYRRLIAELGACS